MPLMQFENWEAKLSKKGCGLETDLPEKERIILNSENAQIASNNTLCSGGYLKLNFIVLFVKYHIFLQKAMRIVATTYKNTEAN